MARVSSEPNTTSKRGRAELRIRREPYFRTIQFSSSKGGLILRLGYRRTNGCGTWIAQVYDPETRKRHYNAIGHADDEPNLGGLSYVEAQDKAKEWLDRLNRSRIAGYKPSKNYFLSDVMDDYLRHYERKGGKSDKRVRSVIDTHIKPRFGEILVDQLTKRQVVEWQDAMTRTPPRVRTKRGDTAPRFRTVGDSVEDVRRRRSTANRVLTVLKAALNYAYQEGRIATDAAWRTVKPYREADAARLRYLSDEEARRLVNACESDFRDLVTAALLTGSRYGELTSLVVSDFNPEVGTLHIRKSKSGKSRHIVLTSEGRSFFEGLVLKRHAGDRLLLNGSREWRPSEQIRRMRDACERARILPAVSFHELRHTYASRLIMRNAPPIVVAKQLGHADTRMVEKHYGHLAPSYVADTIRASYGELGVC